MPEDCWNLDDHNVFMLSSQTPVVPISGSIEFFELGISSWKEGGDTHSKLTLHVPVQAT